MLLYLSVSDYQLSMELSNIPVCLYHITYFIALTENCDVPADLEVYLNRGARSCQQCLEGRLWRCKGLCGTTFGQVWIRMHDHPMQTCLRLIGEAILGLSCLVSPRLHLKQSWVL